MASPAFLWAEDNGLCLQAVRNPPNASSCPMEPPAPAIRRGPGLAAGPCTSLSSTKAPRTLPQRVLARRPRQSASSSSRKESQEPHWPPWDWAGLAVQLPGQVVSGGGRMCPRLNQHACVREVCCV